MDDSPKRGRKRRKDEESSASDYSEGEETSETKAVPLKKRRAAAAHSDEEGSSGGEEEEEEEEEYNDEYDANLIIDDKDREYLSSLSEMERERILNERYDKRKAEKERFEMRKKLRQDNKRKLRSRKAKSGSKAGNKASAFSSFKAERRAKASRAKDKGDDETGEEKSKKHKRDRKDRDNTSPPDDRDRSSSSTSKSHSKSSSRHDSSSPPKSPTLSQLPKKEDLNRVRITRIQLEKWMNQPFFENIVGYFVRIGLGLNAATSQRTYRVAQISKIVRGTAMYNMGQRQTNVQLELQHGKDKKVFNMEYISNSDFTESEVNKWRDDMETANQSIITLAEIAEKAHQLEKFQTYTYTYADVDRMVQAKKEQMGKPMNITKELAILHSQKSEVDSEEKRSEIDNRIQELQQIKDQENAALVGKIKVSDINKRNKELNFELKDQAVKEKRNKKGTEGEKKWDPFSRRPTQPISFVTRPTADAPKEPPKDPLAPTPSTSAPTSTAKPANTTTGSTATTATTGQTNGKEKGKDLEKAHDFDIDLDLDLTKAGSAPRPVVTPKPRTSTPLSSFPPPSALKSRTTVSTSSNGEKKALSVDDYKRRRGI